MKVCTAEEMRNIDALAMKKFNIPGIVLMENAAQSCTREIANFNKFVVVCGKGNNGGDGLAIGRQLINLGKEVKIYLAFSDEYSGDAYINREILRSMEKEVTVFCNEKEFVADIKNADCVVDAIFGTGIKGEVSGNAKTIIEDINNFSKYTLAVDVPSGINSDTGEVSGVCINADKTVTFAAYKRGLLLYPARNYTGEIVVANIEIPKKAFEIEGVCVNTIDEDYVKTNLPKRRADSHKGDYGKILVIGGQKGMEGAVCLSCLAALRMGAGLVTACVPYEIADYVETCPLEAMTIPADFEKESDRIADMVNNYDVVLFGNGIGREEYVLPLLEKILDKITVPIVIDADGLFALAKKPELIFEKDAVLTPHSAEMARFFGISPDDVEKDRLNLSKSFCDKYRVTLVLKGNHSIITAPSGIQNINMTGNSGMATAGSGDVLAGMIAAQLALCEPFSAASLGVYLHGKAGDYAKEKLSETAIIASDIVNSIPHILPVENGKKV